MPGMVDSTGYTTVSIKPDTRERIRELRHRRDTTTDELLKSLLDGADEDV